MAPPAGMPKTFDLDCTLDLTNEDGTVLVKRFDYELKPASGTTRTRSRGLVRSRRPDRSGPVRGRPRRIEAHDDTEGDG